MYRLYKFGLTELTHYNETDNNGSGSTPTSYQILPEGGALDLYGGMTKHPGTVERSKSFRLRGSSAVNLEQLYFALLQLRGKRDRLYRLTLSGDIHWMYARLAEVTAQRAFEMTQYKLIQDVDLRFVTQESTWRGDYNGVWYLDAGEYLDSGLVYDSGEVHALTTSPTAISVTNGAAAGVGRAAVRSLRITISAGASSMSAITITRTGGEAITFSGTILANKNLVIDTGTMQVLNDGADAYASLTLAPTADLAAWFSLAPGANAITVAFTGGGTGKQIKFEFYEAWY